MSVLENWLSDDKNRRSVPTDEWQIVLKELVCKDVGVKGSNVFTITYPVVASVSCVKALIVFYKI